MGVPLRIHRYLLDRLMQAFAASEGLSARDLARLGGRGAGGTRAVNKLLVAWFLIACPSSRTTRKNSCLNNSPWTLSYSSVHVSSFNFFPAIFRIALSEGKALVISL